MTPRPHRGNRKGERKDFNAALVSVLGKHIFCYRMFFSPASTQPSHERWRKNEGFAYEILAVLIKGLSTSFSIYLWLYLFISHKHWSPFLPKVQHEVDVQTNIRWCVCVHLCVLQENGIFYGCLSGLGELSGGGGCSWAFCGGPLSQGVAGA